MDVQSLLALYHTIDQRIEKHFQDHPQKKGPCAKGCASCCSQFFEITSLEFDGIKAHLNTLNSDVLLALKERSLQYVEAFESFHGDFYRQYFTDANAYQEEAYYKDKRRYKIHMPCIFLSEEGACTIYPYRPLVCRTTGVSYLDKKEIGAVCREIPWAFLARRWQADLTDYAPTLNEIRWPHQEGRRQYPIFYHVYRYLNE